MRDTILEIVETHRKDSEYEVQELIDACKAEANEGQYVLKGYSTKLKTKTQKKEIIDQGWEVKITKQFNSFWEV